MTTTVVNRRRSSYDVYIGRPTIFGNPYPLSPRNPRGSTLERYRAYFEARVKEDPRLPLSGPRTEW